MRAKCARSGRTKPSDCSEFLAPSSSITSAPSARNPAARAPCGSIEITEWAMPLPASWRTMLLSVPSAPPSPSPEMRCATRMIQPATCRLRW